MSAEAKVGFFVVLGLAMLFMLTTQVNKFRNIEADGYRVEVYIDDSTGLSKNTKVKMNGINVGWIEDLRIAEDFVIVTLFIKKDYNIPKNSEVLLVQESLLGSRLVLIKRGDSREFLEDGEFLKKYKVYSSFEQTSDSIYQTSEEFGKLAQEIRDTLNQDTRDDVREAIDSLNIMLLELKEMVQENREGIRNTVSNIELATNRLPEVVASLERTIEKYHDVGVTVDQEVEDVAKYLKSLIYELNGTVAENREPLNSSLKSVDGFFSKGEKSIEKLDKILSSLTESELQFSMRVENNRRDQTFKSYVDVAYLPNPNTYYMFSLISSPDFEAYDESGDIGDKLHDEGKTYFSLQYGKRYDDWLFRAGLIESRGGFGVDYFTLEDKLKLSMEAFDFNAVNDARNEKANLKTTLRYRVFNHIDLFVGGSNLLNDQRGVFFGAGFYFIDNDLRTLAGLAGGTSL
jgi:phospholipid/cholesterol/gamma-HCH transport system substrate-binding protein